MKVSKKIEEQDFAMKNANHLSYAIKPEELQIGAKIKSQLSEQLGLKLKPRTWGFIFRLNGMQRLIKMAEHCLDAHESTEFFDKLFNAFKISYTVSPEPKIPTEGGLIMVSNHPMGLPETSFLLDFALRVRPDIKVLATSLVPPVPHLYHTIIPINVYDTSKQGKKLAIEQMRLVKEHLVNGGALLIFPAGMMSISQNGMILDPTWNITFAKLAQETGVPIAPFHVESTNPKWFYKLDKIHPLLRTFLMPRMFTNKKNRHFLIQGQPLITADEVSAFTSAEALRDYCYSECVLMPKRPDSHQV
jgi:putative hemolysin